MAREGGVPARALRRFGRPPGPEARLGGRGGSKAPRRIPPPESPPYSAAAFAPPRPT